MEQYLNWDGMDSNFDNRVEQWAYDVENSESPYELAELLVELESYMIHQCLPREWRDMRHDWKKDAKDVETFEDVAQLIIDFDYALTRDVVSNKFLNKKRNKWLKNLEYLVEE